jgi:hypothetical protein
MSTLVLRQGSRQFEDGIWRVRDVDLALFLGYAAPREIRRRIKRHRDALEEFGPLICVTVPQINTRGPDPEEFWLNKKQAYFLVARGETKEADELLIVLVDTFDAFERGELVPKERTGQMIVLDREKDEIAHRFARLENRQERFEGNLGRVEGKVDKANDCLERIEGKLDSQSAILTEIKTTQQHRRKDISFHVEITHLACVQHRLNGYCPCCHVEKIVVDGFKTEEFEMDHWYGRHQPRLSETWPVCHKCNQKLRHPDFHRAKQPEFDSYQGTLTVFYGPLFEA